MDEYSGATDPPDTRFCTATSTYYVYMVETPNNGMLGKDKPDDEPPKHHRLHHCSEARKSHASNTGSWDIDASVDADDNGDPVTDEPGH